MRRITIIRIRKPESPSINEELQWFGSSLGLFNLRDKDRSCFRIFIELLKSTKKSTSMTSDQIAYKLSLSRGTVVHHLTKLQESGLVIFEDRGYMLRVNNLRKLVEELEEDMKQACKTLKEIADDIDSHVR